MNQAESQALNLDESNNSKKEATKQKKGFMALRNNVYDLKLELWHILKPLEMHLVDIIIDRTIKWKQEEAKISIQEFMEKTRQDHTRIYRALKALEDRKVIVRRKHKHDLVIGLNKEYFGDLLIKKHEEALLARKSRVKLVVDNSKNVCKTSTDVVHNPHIPCVPDAQVLCKTDTEKVRQVHDNIDENPPLKTLLKDIPINTSLKESQKEAGIGESFTLLGNGEEEAEGKEKISQLIGGLFTSMPKEQIKKFTQVTRVVPPPVLTGEALQRDLEETAAKKAAQLKMFATMNG